MANQQEFLSFTFAPHVLEDLGVNLYTSVEKALVEFVANSYDADAPSVRISFDEADIKRARDILKADFEHEKSKVSAETSKTVGQQISPLAERTLPETVQITIEDNGDGMNRSDLQNKFLRIGRRRRKGREKTARTNNGRIIMGRKGLGKLAGFGIAHVIEVTSKVSSESHATRITLNLDMLLLDTPPSAPAISTDSVDADEVAAEKPAHETPVPVPVQTIADGAGLIKGTRIVLKHLVYDALRGDLSKKLHGALAENFFAIKPNDFAITINGSPVDTTKGNFAYAFPDPSKPATELIPYSLPVDGGPGAVNFAYRILFLPPKKQLSAKQRGIRVYAHHRLASAPDLLEVTSNAHGFQYTSYLEGIVDADFIDDQPTDYISTDRQTLRWDTPILSPLREFLTKEITRALAAYADFVSAGLENKLKDDKYTEGVILGGKLPPHRVKTAWQLAKILAGKDAGNLESEFYQNTIKSVVLGLGHGEILETIHKLAGEDKPDLRDVIREITKLTRHEFDEFMAIIDGRLRAIETLAKLVIGVDFKAAKNEGDLHELFEQNPWLIDPTFFEFLTSDEQENVLAARLSKELAIGKHVPPDYDKNSPKEANPLENNERPDLTFLLTNTSLKRLVIVELKAPNTPLHIDHLIQLNGYMQSAEEFIRARPEFAGTKVEGILIGSRATGTKAKKVRALDYQIEKEMTSNSSWRVFDLIEVFNRTEAAHREIWQTYKKASGVVTKPV